MVLLVWIVYSCISRCQTWLNPKSTYWTPFSKRVHTLNRESRHMSVRQWAAKVTLKKTPAPTHGRERQSFPHYRKHRMIFFSSPPEICSSILRKVFQCHCQIWLPEVGICPLCKEQHRTCGSIKKHEAEEVNVWWERNRYNVKWEMPK